MKKVCLLFVSFLLVITCVVSVNAASNASISGDSSVALGNTIELVLSVSGCPNATSAAVVVDYSNHFELVSGTWLKAGSITNFDTGTNKGAVGALRSPDINGRLFKLVLRAKSLTASAQPVSVTVFAKNGATEIMNTTVTKSISVVCATHSYGPWSKISDTQHRRICSKCHSVDTANHTWNNGEITKAATCKETGTKLYTCTGCKATKTVVVPKQSTHTYSNACDTSCNICGATRVTVHSYTRKVTKPTCTEKGYTTYTCECGDTYKADYVNAKGHTYSKGKCKACGYKPVGVKITAQPTNAAVKNGKTAKVTVKATGTGLKYTWYYAKKGSSKFTKTTVTSASYSVKMSSAVNGRKVYCVVTDKYGNSVKSSTVTLYKGTPAKITTQPKGVTVANGKTGSITLKASGSSLKYTWYVKYKGASVFTKVGKSSKTYSFKMAAKLSGAQAYCVVKDKYGITVKSSVVTIKLAPQPKITTQPKSVTQVSGKTVKFSIKASGEGLKYQWYYAKKGSSSFKKLSGARSATYSVKVSSSVNGRKYYCLVTDKYGQTVKSSVVTVNLAAKPKITTQPKSVTVASGKIAKFAVKASGAGLKYQWYYAKKGSSSYKKLSGANSATYSVNVSSSVNGSKYYCIVTDKYGQTVKSSTATLSMV